MRSIIDKARKQTAVYWAPADPPFDEYGRPSLDSPVALTVRWVETAEEFLDAQGTRVLSQIKVLLGQDVVVGGLLMLGTLDEAEASDFPANPKEGGAFEIRSFKKAPSLKVDRYLRVVML